MIGCFLYIDNVWSLVATIVWSLWFVKKINCCFRTNKLNLLNTEPLERSSPFGGIEVGSQNSNPSRFLKCPFN